MKHVIVADKFDVFERNIDFFKKQCVALNRMILSGQFRMTTFNNDNDGYRKRYSVTFKTN